MKRSKWMVLSLAFALVVMGTAYAAWTQQVNVTSTVNTGELEITVSDQAVLGQYMDENGMLVGSVGDEDGLADAVLDVATNELIQVSTSNFFPGTVYVLDFKLTNSGTIPADIDLNALTGEDFDMPANENMLYTISVTGKDDVVGTDLAAVIANVEQINLEATNDFVDVQVKAEMLKDATELQLAEEYNYEFGFTIDISQFNVD